MRNVRYLADINLFVLLQSKNKHGTTSHLSNDTKDKPKSSCNKLKRRGKLKLTEKEEPIDYCNNYYNDKGYFDDPTSLPRLLPNFSNIISRVHTLAFRGPVRVRFVVQAVIVLFKLTILVIWDLILNGVKNAVL